MALSEDDLNLLLNLIRHPWSSVGQMADVLQMTRQEIKINMQNLIERGYAQHITQSLQPYTKALYAPSNVGLRVAAQQVDISPEKLAKRLGCSSLRFWQLRAGLTVAREANLFCAVLARHMLQHGQAQTRWELFVERCHEHTPILIHARINVAFKNRTCTYYLLVDDGEHSIWMWWRHLRYFGLWSKRVSERFPPLLLLTTNEFRASALMLLAKQLAPTIVTVATADRDHVMGNVGFGEARWLKLIGSAKGSATYQAIPCHPFTTDLIVTESTLDEKHRVTVTSLASLKKRLRAGSKKHAQESATFDLERPPAQLSGMVNLEQCNNATYELLGFICHHPACPTSIIEGSLGCSLEELVANLQQLLELGLIQSNPLERDDQVIQLWAATEEGMLLRILRQVCPRPERYVARYLRTVADHLRRPDHTLAIYDFFERLQQHAQGWSRVTRAVDSSVTSVSEGRIPHYE